MTPDLLTRFRRAALATTAGLLSVASACSGGAAHGGGQDAAGGGSGGMAAGGSSRADSSAAGGGAGGALAGGAGGQGTQKGSGGVGGNPRDAGTTADQAMDSPSAARAEQACRDAIVAQCERRTICLGGSYSDCARVADRCPDYYFALDHVSGTQHQHWLHGAKSA
jgi:hypothetical protein